MADEDFRVTFLGHLIDSCPVSLTLLSLSYVGMLRRWLKNLHCPLSNCMVLRLPVTGLLRAISRFKELQGASHQEIIS